ncbi:MAG: NAD(P)/FAD-dependent oxidoreductase [Amphiplicatus sp.]|uniref:NAD(P)/FAD-dependent oxidoreductase n=1 Tax=Methylocystis sp. TaxID=1911079 RepID=UPI003D0BD9CB
MSFDGNKDANRVIVIGAGPMGLAAAYYAAKAGRAVTVFEADDRVGGMAAHFDFDGLSIERFYHFCCLSDVDTLALMDELGMNGAMKWVRTTMGFYAGGALYDWGDPIALLKFPGLNFIEKLRYGMQAFTSTKRSDWRNLDRISAEDWFIAWCGRSVYERLWKPLLALKFYDHAGEISAAWMWQRIKRLGNSRKSLFEERLGYIEGGSERLMIALADAIRKTGGEIRLKTPVRRILFRDGAALGVELASGERALGPHVVSTAPIPHVVDMLAEAPADFTAPYARIKNIGVVCVMAKLKKSVSPHFWVNISDARVEIPGLVEFSNLRPLPNTIVYVPFYMPQGNPKFSRPDADFVSDALAAIRLVNPGIGEKDVIATHVGRLRYAQPVCEVGFSAMIPKAQTAIRGLQIADTCFYYPEDRGVSESVKFARGLAAAISSAEAA